MQLMPITALVLAMGLAFCAQADTVADLGGKLTPTGAEKAGNADGSIPAWDGGLKPDAGLVDAKGGYADPYAAEKPLFTVTPATAGQYSQWLSPGEQAMLKRYPNTYRINVYPSHRSARLPDEINTATRDNVGKARLADGGNGVLNYQRGVPFPLPSEGVEAIWNHITRYRGGSLERTFSSANVKENGVYSLVRSQTEMNYAETVDDLPQDANLLYLFKTRVLEPARLSGEAVLTHEPMDQVAEPRAAWQYIPGQRRVRRAPLIAYDNSARYSDGMVTADSLDGFNGAPDRYEWKLVGKQELFVPYNSFRLYDRSVKYADILKTGHLNPDLARFEKHRVWVVEATLRPGARHVYSKRRYYLDEDSWNILLGELYDSRGELWRNYQSHAMPYYDKQFTYEALAAAYDLISGRYFVNGLMNEESSGLKTGQRAKMSDYTPSDLRRWAK